MSKKSTAMKTSPGELSDEALLQRVRMAGESEDFRVLASELLGRYHRRVYVWCHRFVRDHERALDLSQDVLMLAYRALDRFDGRSSLSTWLFVITRNRCLTELARPSLLCDPEIDPDSCSSQDTDPESELLEKEDEEAVLLLIRTHLDEEEQKALWMRCFERMPVDLITRVLELEGPNGARVVLQRARRKLRRVLKESA